MKVVIRHAGRWLCFQHPDEVLTTDRIEEVQPLLERAASSGHYAAGFISYEAASAFDPALKTHSAGGFPLLCLGLYSAPDVLDTIESRPESAFEVGDLNPSISREDFSSAIAAIKEQIAAGATYQVNYTYRLHAPFSGDTWGFFCQLIKNQRNDCAAYIEHAEFTICSASPEQFFTLRDGVLTSRPMKGTARRGRTLDEDRQRAERLAASEKDRAENIMVVDMIRNDIGRVAVPGSVKTISTYDIEKYPTVWQMTSTVQGLLTPAPAAPEKAGEDLFRVLKALFPCASITGAPKAKTMEIIRSLESTPRRIYTGAIGFYAPHGEAAFNVAIRTALIQNGQLEFGVGGGIVWDSDTNSEYDETLTKARVLSQPAPDFKLLETMLWEPGEDVFLWDEHMQRLKNSANYFDIPLDLSALQKLLEEIHHTFEGVLHRIRLLVAPDGTPDIESFPFEETSEAATVAWATHPVDSEDIFLFHKTTHRVVYDRAREDFPECDDVLLFNERGEVTESTTANVVIRREGRLITPPVACGLLAGTFRAHLIASGELEESVITRAELEQTEEVYLINSVRRWRRVRWATDR